MFHQFLACCLNGLYFIGFQFFLPSQGCCSGISSLCVVELLLGILFVGVFFYPLSCVFTQLFGKCKVVDFNTFPQRIDSDRVIQDFQKCVGESWFQLCSFLYVFHLSLAHAHCKRLRDLMLGVHGMGFSSRISQEMNHSNFVHTINVLLQEILQFFHRCSHQFGRNLLVFQT